VTFSSPTVAMITWHARTKAFGES